ncbi:DUF2815 family protein [Clostridium sp. 'deep sea']|uniref:DUF2815 family protein n=1 Tax=Clostridium sp. 'deep sea' TaxID=2779445 RepID=UPI00189677C6|nr:DUF2815 family protein [Clostridium sp. 'deep sea']QOR34422.1 DUF2815 family protein [Clostridium sp. 'deep sea']
MTNKMQETKVTTGLVRFSYLNVWEPRAASEGQDPKYSVSLIIPKSDKKTIKKIEKAIENAKLAGKASKFNGKLPANLKTPLRDGDEERDDEAYENSYFLNATSKTKPGVIDRSGNRILDQEEIYSGCYGHASINFYAFNVNGNKGIACGLNNIMKKEEGEYLGGRSTAESDFAELIGQDDDDDLL